jgi:hypothetical protein
VKQLRRRIEDERPRVSIVRPSRLRGDLPLLPGPRALLPHERCFRARPLPHPSSAFPLMAPAAAQGRPRGVPALSFETRLDAMLSDAQAALDRMRARAQAAREALREARQAPAPATRGRFVVPTITTVNDGDNS